MVKIKNPLPPLFLTLLIITSFIYVIDPKPVYEDGYRPYFDVVFLAGDNFNYYNFSISGAFNNTLNLITTDLNLSYKMFQQDHFPLVQAKMVILFAHGNSKTTVLFTKQYSNSETATWLKKTSAEFFISESCFSGRFLSLPSSINVLASSLNEESGVSLLFNTTLTGELISPPVIYRSLLFFFLQVFSFSDFNDLFNLIVDLFETVSTQDSQNIWSKSNGQLVTQKV